VFDKVPVCAILILKYTSVAPNKHYGPVNTVETQQQYCGRSAAGGHKTYFTHTCFYERMSGYDLVDIEVTHEAADDLLDSLSEDGAEGEHLQSIQAVRLQAGQPDSELRSLKELDENSVKLLEHQVDAAYRALFEMDGKALLADEVGLGKTIEVGMILKEMHFRETDESVLILTPAQLAKQWQAELRDKFGLDFICNYDDEFEDFDAHDYIIASIDTAKSDRHRQTVLNRDWDILVLDEAHYVKNEETDRYDLIDRLSYNYAFFLTATPIQNELTDLYNVVSLLRPGLFGTRDVFHHYFVNSNQETLVNRDELQDRLNKVMIRNRREDTDIDFTDRTIDTRTFDPTTEGTRTLSSSLRLRQRCVQSGPGSETRTDAPSEGGRQQPARAQADHREATLRPVGAHAR